MPYTNKELLLKGATDTEGSSVHSTVSVGKITEIKANRIMLGKDVKIGDNVKIDVVGDFILGDYSIIGDNVTIDCTRFVAGTWLYMMNGAEVGRGGSRGPNSNVLIGDHVGIFERAILNPSEQITIGDNVGIGAEVMIWTHGAWLDITDGFPSDFGPVYIGDDVWLPARCIVLPNVTIGSKAVIGIGSVINRDIEGYSFSAGSPCKVIKGNAYPKPVRDEDLATMMFGIISDWKELAKHKKIEFKSISLAEPHQVVLYEGDAFTVFDVLAKEMRGASTPVSEDFRDYLRRRGIKIYNDGHFLSVKV